MVSCDYNGWNDAPEDEREWFDAHPEIWSGVTPTGDIRPLPATVALAPSDASGRPHRRAA